MTYEPEYIELDALDGAEPLEKSPRKVEDTRAKLAFFLVGLLAFAIASLVVLLWCNRLEEQRFAEVAGLLISPLIGLVGAVTGYYYGKSDR